MKKEIAKKCMNFLMVWCLTVRKINLYGGVELTCWPPGRETKLPILLAVKIKACQKKVRWWSRNNIPIIYYPESMRKAGGIICWSCFVPFDSSGTINSKQTNKQINDEIVFLGQLSPSGDVLLWVGFRRRPRTFSPHTLLGQSLPNLVCSPCRGRGSDDPPPTPRAVNFGVKSVKLMYFSLLFDMVHTNYM